MLNSGVSASGKLTKGLLVTVFQQRKGRMEGCCVSTMGRENETNVGRSCFGNKNDGGMAGWSIRGMRKKMLINGVSALGRESPVFFIGVAASED